MTKFNVPDMTCGHCEAAVLKAIKDVDSSADIKVDLSEHKIDVTSKADNDDILAALNAAGYPSSLAS
ncbi:heavy-metal-associated domain-containing protein [Maritalea mediterranea]|uniref:Heavy-metal-associated domain-containing protein n=1 Tax=Maritalea mediterranea TaxID=2909667 RepID=A0ABS9EBY7_9HYPH|nr:heavy-metal-associated domain-containing protein [Maritalea mediterranea]MCF4098971.1 heavy-metal-associated domain-containing protein [Maritalea mediterranea]